MFYNRQTKHFKLPEEPRAGSGLPAEEGGASCSALPAALGADPGLPGAEGKLLFQGAGCCRKGWPRRPEGRTGSAGPPSRRLDTAHPRPPHRRVWEFFFEIQQLDKGDACVSLPPFV